MLFIRNNQTQTFICDLFLNQRMCSYNHPCRSGCDCFIDLTFFFCCIGSCQKHRPILFQQLIFFQKLCQSFIMLSGEHFCGDHDGALIAVFCCHDHRKECHDSLTAAHVSLYQTGHQFFPPQILFNLIPDILLCPGQLIWQIFHHFLRLPDFFHPVMVFIRCVLFL